MQFPSVTAVDFLVISLSLYLLVVFRDHRKRRGLPYPPGPQSWPIIGNLLDVPSKRPWAAYTEMSNRYGTGHTLPQSLSVPSLRASGGQVTSCVFMFLASSSWCYPRHLLLRTCLKDVENFTQIGPRFRFMRCTPNFACYLFHHIIIPNISDWE